MEKQQLNKVIRKINSWRKVANQRRDYFMRFALEYFAFNALLRLNFSRGEIERDRTLIERLKDCVHCRDIINANHARELKTILDERPLQNLTTNRTIRINGERDWNNIVEAVYVIRNNLFHGHKEYTMERDQQLVKAGYYILRDINDFLIKRISDENAEI